MTVSLWHIASGLGVGAFIAALFFGVVKHFGRTKGQGFQTSQLGKEATAIIAVLIILIFGVVTVVALVLYRPSPGSSARLSEVPPKTRAVAPPTESPVPVARAWLTFVDDGDYDGSWDKSSVRLQTSMDKFNWRKVLTEIRHPMGAPIDRTVISAIPWTKIDEHTYVSQVDFKTHFQTDTKPERFEHIELSATDGLSPAVSAYRMLPYP